jgi:hypothetical protein
MLSHWRDTRVSRAGRGSGFELQLEYLKDDEGNRISDSSDRIPSHVFRHVQNHRDMLNATGMKKVISIQQECLRYCGVGYPDRPDLTNALSHSLLL